MTQNPVLITSRQNPLLREIQAIRDDHSSPLIFLEGPRLIQEAIKAEIALEMLIVGQQFPKTSFLEPIEGKTKRIFHVSEGVFEVVSDVDQPQGLLAIARRPLWDWKDLEKRKPAPVIILDGLQDPGNAAAILRTAEATGAGGAISTPGTARLYSPKALRGAMGSSLRLPILEHKPPEEILEHLRKRGYAVLAATLPKKSEKGVPYTKIDWTEPQALVLGQEAKGVSAVWAPLVDKSVFLPMLPPVESLNVGAAAAAILYEAARQRKVFAK